MLNGYPPEYASQADSRETPRFQTGIRRHTTLPVALYAALYAALPGPHSTVCSAPFRTSYYLIKAYARRAIYRLQAGASVSVTPTFHLPHCMTTPYANLPITDSSGRKYADRGITLPQLLPGAFKKRAADVQFLSALFYLSVCYAHFFTFPYSTATYAKQATYRLKAVDASLLSRLFTYFTELQHYTRISRLQTHQGKNVETSRCSKLSAEKCK